MFFFLFPEDCSSRGVKRMTTYSSREQILSDYLNGDRICSLTLNDILTAQEMSSPTKSTSPAPERISRPAPATTTPPPDIVSRSTGRRPGTTRRTFRAARRTSGRIMKRKHGNDKLLKSLHMLARTIGPALGTPMARWAKNLIREAENYSPAKAARFRSYMDKQVALFEENYKDD